MTFEDMLQDEPYKSCYEKGLADGEAKGRADVWSDIEKIINSMTNPIQTMEIIIKNMKGLE